MYENAQDLLLLATSGGGLLSIVKGTGIVVRLTLLLLVLASVASWAIIIFKAVQMKRMFANSSSFLEYFWHSRKLDEIYENADNFSPCPVAEVFKDGYIELGKIQKARRQKMADSSAGMAELSGLDEDMESVERSLRKAQTTQLDAVESLVPFLATIGSTAPFVGLFGTVWGIMNSFHEIGVTQNATLATVAPGISEALIATATGLAAAIPAVIAYNFFIERIKTLDNEMENFSRDFLNIIKRHFLS